MLPQRAVAARAMQLHTRRLLLVSRQRPRGRSPGNWRPQRRWYFADERRAVVAWLRQTVLGLRPGARPLLTVHSWTEISARRSGRSPLLTAGRRRAPAFSPVAANRPR